MTVEQMNKEIRDYCLSLILKSIVTDWKKEDYRQIIKDNIRITMASNKDYSERFKVYIYTDNSLKNENSTIVFDSGWSPFNREKRKERKLVQKKWDEIYEFFENKSNYERAIKTYNLLPIKELRRKKLQIIEKE